MHVKYEQGWIEGERAIPPSMCTPHDRMMLHENNLISGMTLMILYFWTVYPSSSLYYYIDGRSCLSGARHQDPLEEGVHQTLKGVLRNEGLPKIDPIRKLEG